MPRKPNIRARTQGDPTSDKIAERRAWLSDWKQRAILMLPREAPAGTRAQLRKDVEKALAQHGPGDPFHEVSDIVIGLAQEEVGRLQEKNMGGFSAWVVPAIALAATAVQTPEVQKAIGKGFQSLKTRLTDWIKKEPPGKPSNSDPEGKE